MPLKLYNTASRKKETFKPLVEGKVGIYVCGVTVYDLCHMGHARSTVVFDVLARLLRRRYDLTYARNITDVDDKINKAAQVQGVDIGQITTEFIDIYHEDMAALGVAPVDVEPRATDHIDAIIGMIGKLVDSGHAYEDEGHVLFRVASFDAYGALSRRDQRELIAGARVEVAPYKEAPGDFVLFPQ